MSTRRNKSHVSKHSTRSVANPASPFEPLESRRMFAAISTLQPIDAYAFDPGPVISNGGFSSFSVTDASYDGTSATAFQGGALRVSFNGSFAAGSNVTVQALQGSSVVATVGTYAAPSLGNGLINLPAFSALTPGSYNFRATGTGILGWTVTSASQPMTILPRTNVTGSFQGETINYAGAAGSATVISGLGGSDTLDLGGITTAQVSSFDKLPLGWFSPTLSAVNNSVFRGSAYDHLVLNDGREIYFQGVEKLRFSGGAEYDLAIRPNDTSFDTQWNLHVTDTDSAWRFTRGSSGVLICSLDTGILTASGASGSIYDVSLGRLITDASDDDNYANYGHGHCSISVMSSTNNNASGVAGINNVSSVYVTDVYNGVNLKTAITQALDYAKANNKRVVFQGGIQGEGWLTSGGTQAQLETLINDNDDISFFAIAAGNGGPGGNLTDPNYLTSVSGVAKLQTGHENVMSVGALARTGTATVNGLTNATAVDIASYSNRGSNLTMVAPTNSPAVNKNGTVQSFGGTSCANPNMAGIASLVWAVNPNLDGGDLRNVMTSTAMDLGAAGKDNTFGRGLVNADAAVRRAWAMNKDLALANINQLQIVWPIDDIYVDLQYAYPAPSPAPALPPAAPASSQIGIASARPRSEDLFSEMPVAEAIGLTGAPQPA